MENKESLYSETVRLRNAVKDYCFHVHGFRPETGEVTPQWLASVIDWDAFAILWGVGPQTIAELASWLERNGQEVRFPENRMFSRMRKMISESL